MGRISFLLGNKLHQSTERNEKLLLKIEDLLNALTHIKSEQYRIDITKYIHHVDTPNRYTG